MDGALVELGIVPEVAIAEITFFAEGVGEGILAGVVGVVVLLTAAVFGATVESLSASTDPLTVSVDSSATFPEPFP